MTTIYPLQIHSQACKKPVRLNRFTMSQRMDTLFHAMQVIAVICVLVWVINIPRFGDPVHGNLVSRQPKHLPLPAVDGPLPWGPQPGLLG